MVEPWVHFPGTNTLHKNSWDPSKIPDSTARLDSKPEVPTLNPHSTPTVVTTLPYTQNLELKTIVQPSEEPSKESFDNPSTTLKGTVEGIL